MNSDPTQQQSLGGLRKAEQLSLQSTVPPAEIPGYRLERLLGRGAFGQVWLGIDLNTGRPVAIKYYLHRGQMNVPLLNREVSHLVNMSAGRHIVQVLAVGWDANPPYYVMEFLENGSLEDLVRARGALSISETVGMLREIAEGLCFAHAKGVLHCDLKPANVVLDHSWRPRLADFGQGRLTNEQTPSLGTLFFMAPEQADLEASPDVVWDVYALGAIGYTMLVGSPPYRTPAVVEALDTASNLPDRLERYRRTIEKAPRPRLHYRRRGIDKALCQIIDRCLATDPRRRYANVQQVIEAIDHRQVGRMRRPLYLLGIVGPILLMLLMMLFSMRSISLATQESLGSVVQRSLESNKFAARYAAQTLESEIQSLFRVVEAESRREPLRQLLSKAQQSLEFSLEELAEDSTNALAMRQLLEDQRRLKLEEYLKGRLRTMIEREGHQNAAAIFNTLFVTEQQGSIIGIAFSSSEEQTAKTPVGGNYAYRSYFNGERADGDSSLPSDAFSPTRVTRLSASFRSTATGAWKVGVSSPVWGEDAFEADGETPLPDARPIGVLVLTINLGDFELLAQTRESSSDAATLMASSDATAATAAAGEAGEAAGVMAPGSQAAVAPPPERAEELSDGEDPFIRFAALVDGRSGNQNGTLLQHPLIQRMDRATMKSVLMPQIDPRMFERLQSSGGVYDYQDPAAAFANGHQFEGRWIAAIEQVKLPRVAATEDVRTKSDLWILVQERSSSVAAPVRKLGSQLQRESFIELGTLLLVIIVLWYFVFRIGQASLAKPAVTTGAGSDSSFQSTIEIDR